MIRDVLLLPIVRRQGNGPRHVNVLVHEDLPVTAFVERDDLQPFRARVQPVDVTVGPVDGQGLGVGQAGVNDDILKLIKSNKYIWTTTVKLFLTVSAFPFRSFFCMCVHSIVLFLISVQQTRSSLTM